MAKRPKKLRFFFLDGKLTPNGPTVPLLHRSLHINRPKDQIITWCYPLHKRVTYTYSEVKKHKQPAFTTREVGKMLNRGRLTLERAILDGKIERPQYSYSLDTNKNMHGYQWSEKNIIEMHAYLCTVHRGRPRRDGRVTPQKMPTLRELRAMIRQEPLLYVRNEDGAFVPVWQAQDFT